MDHSKMNSSNPCTDKLTDLQYLEHMIPHHQVAIDMSNMLIPVTKNPIHLHLCRDIIRKQSYEIWEMGTLKNKINETVFSDQTWEVEDFITKLDLYNPISSKAPDGPCNPLFFKPKDHMKQMGAMKLTEKSYLEHMIPHHQVAIDMSRRLMLHTNHSYLMDFCRKLILDQQGEILYMTNIQNSPYTHQSLLL